MTGGSRGAEGGAEVARLAEEQAALRRVATLVAHQTSQAEVFAAIAEELGRVLGVEDIRMIRFAEGTAVVVASWGRLEDVLRVGERHPLGGANVTSRVFETGRPERIDEYSATSGAIAERVGTSGIRSAVGTPIRVEGRLWGAMIAAAGERVPLPPDTESRLGQFTELMGTAIANAQARAELQRLAEIQAALRRVATLVAEGAAPTAVFDAVVVELSKLLGPAEVGLMRREGPDEVTILAHRGQDAELVHAGMRVPLDGDSITTRVLRSGRSARIDPYRGRHGTIAQIAQASNISMGVGAPIVVEGALWGVMTAVWREGDDLPPVDAEERLAEFAELVDTAIANADSRDQLRASRARVLTAGDEARRQVVRDLHDGAQQRLIHAIVTLKLARRLVREDVDQAEALLTEALDHSERGNAELRELAHGILPSVLMRGGLRAGVEALVSRLPLPVDVDVTDTRLPPDIEASGYFIVAEALTNVIKHSQAARAEVSAAVEDGTLRLEVRDDGIGGADPEGHGLLGIGDRVAAFGGRLWIDSPRGGGSVVTAELPLPT